MNNVTELKRGDDQGPGVIRTLSGTLVDLHAPVIENLHIKDIAWSISKQVRYNGHIPYDYTVARHSIIMSYAVPLENAMEALLHDAGEAYCGDIVYPLKRLYPELEEMEDKITGLIMTKFNNGLQTYRPQYGTWTIYQKSEPICYADKAIAQHECYRFGRPGSYMSLYHEAEKVAMSRNGLKSLYRYGSEGDFEAYLHRFYELSEMR